jgi:Rieske Fe-S protein
MATTRRVFLEVLGSGVAVSAMGMGCGSRLIDESIETNGGTPEPTMGTGGGSASGGVPSSGAAGSGVASPTPSGTAGSANGGTGGASGGAGGTIVDATAPLPAGHFTAGNVSTLSPGAVVAMPGANFVIVRDANGIYAVSRVCTHQGCTVNVAPAAAATFNCPCHGSQFDVNGNVLRGPANRPLPHYAVVVDASGNIVVDATTQVAAATRVPV